MALIAIALWRFQMQSSLPLRCSAAREGTRWRSCTNHIFRFAKTMVQKWPNVSIKAAPHAVYLQEFISVSDAWGILEGKDNQRLQQNSSKHGCDVRLLGFPAHSRPLMCLPTARPCRNGDEQISFNKGCLQATSQPLSRPPLLFPILPNYSKATSWNPPFHSKKKPAPHWITPPTLPSQNNELPLPPSFHQLSSRLSCFWVKGQQTETTHRTIQPPHKVQLSPQGAFGTAQQGEAWLV